MSDEPTGQGRAALRGRPGLVAAVLAAAVLATACGSQTAPEPGEADPASAEADTGWFTYGPLHEVAGLEPCGDPEWISAPADWYADEPVYVGNADHVRDEVLAWAQGRPGFEEMWMDRDRNGWLTLGFTEGDAEALQSQVREAFPGEGVVVVAVPYSSAELQQLADEVSAALLAAGAESFGVGPSVPAGRVEVFAGILTAETSTALAAFAGRPLCVETLPAEAAVPEGPQPTEGEGWRLLGEDETGEAYRTGVATTAEQLEDLWREAGLPGAAPEVDFESEIAIWFGAVYGSGCPVRFDDVLVTGDVVHGDVVVPGAPMACNDDANPHAYVVAVQRDRLPSGPFKVQLRAEDPYPGVPQERTVVDVDLSVPGATATDAELHLDQSLIEAQDEPYAAGPGEWLEVGFETPFRLPVEDLPPGCIGQALDTVNEVTWVPTQPGATWPPTWTDLAAYEGGSIVVQALLTEVPAVLTLSAEGESLQFRPARSAAESGGCHE